MKAVTIIQARTGSSRLPGKALLPVAGYPSAVLAALRAANRHQETIFATSDDASDDELAREAHNSGLSVFRGPLHDVLSRYCSASSSMPEDGAVVRLTADNIVPDGHFVEGLVHAFISSRAEYVSTDSDVSGLPYGVCGEIFSVSALRRANHEVASTSDREHVGQWIKRNCNSAVYDPQNLNGDDFSYLRCTIDDQEDYDRIVRLFEPIADPVHVSWQELSRKLAALPGEPTFRVPSRVVAGSRHSALTLGTAQLGTEYGIVNDAGKPSVARGVSMVRMAISHGVTALDTARSYGTSEDVLGEALTGAWGSRVDVITKLDLHKTHADASPVETRARVDESVDFSCRALRVSRLAILLLHRWQDYSSGKSASWQRLLELRGAGKVGILGVSVYHPEEALDALQDPTIGYLQIPMNVLDWRWEMAGVDRAVASRPDVVVHARSALLQGVLAHPVTRWPTVDGFQPYECWQGLERFRREFGRESITDLCLAYVRSLPWVASVVVGCETMEQLDENLRLFRTAGLSREQCERLRRYLPCAPENFLNPPRWKRLHESTAAS